MAGRPHRPGDEGGFGLPVGGRSAGVGRGSIRGKAPRITKAKKGAKKRLSKAKDRLRFEKEMRSFQKGQKSREVNTQKSYSEKDPAARRLADADNRMANRRRETSIAESGRRVVKAQKAVKRAQTTASTPIKSRGGGRRTHFLGDAPK